MFYTRAFICKTNEGNTYSWCICYAVKYILNLIDRSKVQSSSQIHSSLMIVPVGHTWILKWIRLLLPWPGVLPVYFFVGWMYGTAYYWVDHLSIKLSILYPDEQQLFRLSCRGPSPPLSLLIEDVRTEPGRIRERHTASKLEATAFYLPHIVVTIILARWNNLFPKIWQ